MVSIKKVARFLPPEGNRKRASSPDGVTVISADKEHGHISRRRHGHRCVKVPLAGRSVAEVTHRDVVLFGQLEGVPRTDCLRDLCPER